jgi:hypothetical protein
MDQIVRRGVYCGREDGIMGSPEVCRIAEGHWASFWEASSLIYFGSSAWWDLSPACGDNQGGIDVGRTRGDIQRRYATPIGTIDR